jgi:hypothetical protein
VWFIGDKEKTRVSITGMQRQRLKKLKFFQQSKTGLSAA